MTLADAIAAAGMTPPHSLQPGRWVRFPGSGKGRANRSGWCRVISPTLAVYGDWSTGLSATWRDGTHREDAESRRLVAEARQREREFLAERARRWAAAAVQAEQMIAAATPLTHPYLGAKGFPTALGMVRDGLLLVPVRDAMRYQSVLSLQMIAADGDKKFLPGGRTSRGIFRIGAPAGVAQRVVLVEGYATGLSVDSALSRLPGTRSVIVCFSARNLEAVAAIYPMAKIAADNDASGTGERSAQATGLRYVMPPDIGTDFNDMHARHGLHAVTEAMRTLF